MKNAMKSVKQEILKINQQIIKIQTIRKEIRSVFDSFDAQSMQDNEAHHEKIEACILDQNKMLVDAKADKRSSLGINKK